MTKFRIYHFEDHESIVNEMKSSVLEMNMELAVHEIFIEYFPVESYTKFSHEFAGATPDYDLFIVDIYESNNGKEQQVGNKILNRLKSCNKPAIIYSFGTEKGNEWNADVYKKDFPFIQEVVIKVGVNTNLTNAIKKVIFSRKEFKNLYEYDEFSPVIRATIEYLGNANLVEFLYHIRSEKKFNQPFHLMPFKRGFSGAVLMRITVEGKNALIKVSRQIEDLREEHKKSQSDYLQFPFRVGVDRLAFENREIYGIIQFEAVNSTTLFDWLVALNGDHGSRSVIEDFFNTLFLSDSLNHVYQSSRTTEKYRFGHILKRFNFLKIGQVGAAMDELEPILKSLRCRYDEGGLMELLYDRHFGSIRNENLSLDRFGKPLVLCHGDMHAKNILVQKKRPVIIDAGGVGTDYWCMDICRLIVNLYMIGIDHGTAKYFDINDIENKISLGNHLIDMSPLPDIEGSMGFVHAINWLLEHAQVIYGDLFSKWEFQMGLLKELLQLTYRTEGVPPNKKVIALVTASNCLEAAEKGVRAIIRK